MSVVLYFKDNGFGLTQDAKVVTAILNAAGYHVLHSPPEKPIDADISIHFEIPATAGIRRSRRSIFFPNFEWFFFDTAVLKRFDVIACKTEQALPLARAYSDNVVYTGFISEDMWQLVSKKEMEFFHIAGGSLLKNTEVVFETWRQHEWLPTLHLYTQKYQFEAVPKNVKYHFGPVNRLELKQTMNRCMFAIQPSATEGFGQILWEALSTGAILLTTNAAPMSEIPTALTIPAHQVGYHNLQPMYVPESIDIASVIRHVLRLPKHWVAQHSIEARQAWVQTKAEFSERLLDLL